MYIAKMVIGSPPNPFAEFLRMPPEPLPPATGAVEVDAVLSTPGYHPAEPFPPFTAPVQFRFDERVNLFVGPNATGKSTLLAHLFDRLASGIQSIPDTCDWGLLEFPEPRSNYLHYQRMLAIMGQSVALRQILNSLPLIAIPATRISHGANQSNQEVMHGSAMRVIAGNLTQPLYAESVQRIVDEVRTEIEEMWSSLNEQLRDEYENDNWRIPPGWSADDYIAKESDYSSISSLLQQAINVAYSCAKEICREIIAGDAPHNATIVHESVTDAGLPTVSATLEMGARVQTSDPAQRYAGAQPLAIEQLSAGTQGTLWWIRLIALCLLKASDYEHGWERHEAILLIDEIENHLHPTWQRRVIPALLKYFPGLQIFATTHSPFVVAGLKAGQVHILQRDADSGVITASTNTEDIVGWTMDEILRAFMGVADPTDDATAEAAQELRHLRNAGPAADAQDEERRQTRMQHLRRQVDRDLLAGGPKARRREEFAQQFAEALEKRRQAQSLNQDGADHALG